MQGPRELKVFVSKYAKQLKACNFDSLKIFKLEKCKKYRKMHRRPRDGYVYRETIEQMALSY